MAFPELCHVMVLAGLVSVRSRRKENQEGLRHFLNIQWVHEHRTVSVPDTSGYPAIAAAFVA